MRVKGFIIAPIRIAHYRIYDDRSFIVKHTGPVIAQDHGKLDSLGMPADPAQGE